MLKRIAALVVICVIGPACGGGSGGDAKSEDKDERKVFPLSDTTVEQHYVVTVEGDRKMQFDGRQRLRFVVREGSGESLAQSIASVTLPEPLPLEEGTTVQPEVGVAGVYRGDGTYKIPAGIGQAPTTGITVPKPPDDDAASVSALQVTFTVRQPTPHEDRFGYLLEPCTVVFKENARRGSADCPALMTVKGERVSMKIRWEP